MNEGLLNKRYKIIRELKDEGDYALFEVVDILEREMPALFLNLYKGTLMHKYGRIYDGLDTRECPEFYGKFLNDGALGVLFKISSGVSVESFVSRKKKMDARTRIEWAEIFFHKALTLKNVSPYVACRGFSKDNLLLDEMTMTVEPVYAVAPLDEANDKTLVHEVFAHVRLFLKNDRKSLCEQRLFMERFESGVHRDVVKLYADWRKVKEEITKELDELDGKMFIGKLIFWVKQRAKYKKQKRRNNR